MAHEVRRSLADDRLTQAALGIAELAVHEAILRHGASDGLAATAPTDIAIYIAWPGAFRRGLAKWTAGVEVRADVADQAGVAALAVIFALATQAFDAGQVSLALGV